MALADSAPDESVRESAIEFADVAVSLHSRASGGPTATQAEIEAVISKVEAS